jgi:hypothetical protein
MKPDYTKAALRNIGGMKSKQPVAGTRLYSPRAALCAIGIKRSSLKFFDPIAEHVQDRQGSSRAGSAWPHSEEVMHSLVSLWQFTQRNR